MNSNKIIFIYFFTAIWLNTCKKKDPNLDECIRMTFQSMFPYLAKGKHINIDQPNYDVFIFELEIILMKP